MTEILSTLAFALMMGVPVLAVHQLKNAAQAGSTSVCGMPRFSDHSLFVTAERLHLSL